LKALIIKPGALGDTLMVLPSLVDLAGKAAVTFVGREPGLSFIRDHVDRTMDLEARAWTGLFMERPEGESPLRYDVDLVAAFFEDRDGSIRRNLKTYFPGVPVHCFPSVPAREEPIHVALYLGHCLRSAGLPVEAEKAFQAARKVGLLCPGESISARETVIIHPGSGSKDKNLAPRFWIRVLAGLRQKPPFQDMAPVFLVGPAEMDLAPHLEENLKATQGQVRICPEKSGLHTLFKEARLFLGHDSGITHVAAMFGVPTVSLFKMSDPLQWRPLGPQVAVIQGQEASMELVERVVEASRSLVTRALGLS